MNGHYPIVHKSGLIKVSYYPENPCEDEFLLFDDVVDLNENMKLDFYPLLEGTIKLNLIENILPQSTNELLCPIDRVRMIITDVDPIWVSSSYIKEKDFSAYDIEIDQSKP